MLLFSDILYKIDNLFNYRYNPTILFTLIEISDLVVNETLTRHDRRRAQTRKLLQDAMLDLLTERSFEDLVVQEITDRADVGRGTFYFHFDSKEDVLWSIGEERFLDEMAVETGVADERMPNQPEFYRYVDDFRYFEKNRTVFLAIFGHNGSQSVSSRVRRELAAKVVEDIETRNYFQSIQQPIEITAQIVVGLVTSLAVWWLEKPAALTALQMGEILYQTLHHQEPPSGTWQGSSSG